MRALARVTLANFGLMLFLSLFMLIPQSAIATSRFLIAGGIFSVAVILPSLVAMARSRTRTLGTWQPYVRFGSSVLAYAAVITAGWLLGRGSLDAAFRALLVVVLVLAVVSLTSSWDLLVCDRFTPQAQCHHQAIRPRNRRAIGIVRSLRTNAPT